MDNKGNISLEFFYKKCKEHNLKITPQRATIYEALFNNKTHPSADAVFQRVRKKIPNISFDTVNRTLISFVGAGILKMVESYGRPKRFDPDTGNHHHFRCLKCNSILDFIDKGFDSLAVPKDIQNRFTITGKKVVLEGICNSCRK
ncbi:MAG: transcriptional repressor [Candidatus Omnitrophica bacterium]|jgi:Fur family peroxide stress response transcriptional regulator|nr:transcriptional repressor [Candidatus Omnitrophota bacterium]